MSNLRAGSYLRLLRDPSLDLLEIVDEQTVPLRKKSYNHQRAIEASLDRWEDFQHEPEQRDFSMLELLDDASISYECTYGRRFANCNQSSTSFTLTPVLVPGPPVTAAFAHNGSSDPEDWTWHSISKSPTGDLLGDPRYGLVWWDVGVDNDLFPGYPDRPAHLPVEEDELDIEEELVRAYDTIRPAVTSDMSLLVTLAELKDVVSLFREPLTFAERIVHALGRRKAKRLTMKSILTDPDLLGHITKTLAKGHLYTEFGLKQTERDICSLYTVMLSVDRLVRDVLSKTGENTRHYSVPLYQSRAEVFEHLFQDENWIISRVWNTVLTRKFVVTMKYTTELVDVYGRPISPNDAFFVKAGAVMDSLGVNMNPAILWDLVPFSFVVDYFIGIGDWLERYKRSNLNLTFSVSDSCYSLKKETSTTGTTRRWTSIWNGQSLYPDHPLAACEKYIGGVEFSYQTKEYHRTRFLPTLRMLSGLRAPDVRLPNIKQLMVLSSLVTANIPVVGRRGKGRASSKRSRSQSRRL